MSRLAEARRDLALLRNASRTRRRGIPRDAEAFAGERTVFDTHWARGPWATQLRSVLQAGVLAPVLRAGLNLDLHGVQRLAGARGPLIIVANYSHGIDPLLVLAALPGALRARTAVVATRRTFRTRLGGTAAALALNAFPVELTEPAGSTSPLTLLEEGWNLVLFPEGRPSADGTLGEFNPVVALLAHVTGASVVPVGIRGSFVLPGLPETLRGVARDRAPRVAVRIGDPLRFAEAESADDFTRRMREAITALVDEDATTWWQVTQGSRRPDRSDEAPWRRLWAETTPALEGGARRRRRIWR